MLVENVCRAYALPPVPKIEPIRDDFLVGFGRSFTESVKVAKLQGAGEDDGEEHSEEGSEESSGEEDRGEEETDAPLALQSGEASSNVERHSQNLSRSAKKHGVLVSNLPYEMCTEIRLNQFFSKKDFGNVIGVVLAKPPEGRT